MVNVPRSCSEDGLAQLFSKFGAVRNVRIGVYAPNTSTTPSMCAVAVRGVRDRHWEAVTGCGGLGIAHIVFREEDGVRRALAATQLRRSLRIGAKATAAAAASLAVGSSQKQAAPVAAASPGEGALGQWRAVFAAARERAEPAALQKEVDAFMKKFDAEEARKKQELLDSLNKPDEDGWTTVSRGGRRAQNVGTDGAAVRAVKREHAEEVAAMRREKEEKKRQEMANFYGVSFVVCLTAAPFTLSTRLP